MPNSVLLSAFSVIVITGITLTTIRYQGTNNDHSNVIQMDVDDDYIETIDATRLNPKFRFHDVLDKNYSTEKSSIVKRSSDDVFNIAEYSIDEKNVSMVDEERREKVKQVQTVHGSTILLVNSFAYLFYSISYH